jgi:hypothetical protein
MAKHMQGAGTSTHRRGHTFGNDHLVSPRMRSAAVALLAALIAGVLFTAPALANWTEPLLVDPGNSLEAVTCTTSSTCLALDSNGNLIASDANGLGPAAPSAWTAPTPVGFTGNGGTFTAIACPGGLAFCAAFDSNGNVFYSADPLSQPATWKTYAALNEIFGGNSESGENTDQADALACAPSSSSAAPPAFCLVADTHGNLAYTTEISDARNEFGGLTWSAPYSADPSWDEYEPTAITSISCPSASLCLGTDKLGNIIESTNPVQQAEQDEQWTVLNSIDAGAGSLNDSPGVRGISCPSVTLCVAVDGSGNILYTETPTAVHQGGWTVVPSLNPAGGITGISCPTTTECVITDQGGAIQYGTAPFNSRTVIAPVVPPPPPAPAARPARPSISRLTATIHGARVMISCSSGSGSCAGSVTLSITEKLVANRIVAFTAKRKARAKVVVLGRASFDIPSGSTKVIGVKYNKTGKSLLRRYHRLRGRVEVVQGSVAVRTSGSL